MSVFSNLRTGAHVIELDEPLALVGEAMEPPVNGNMFKMQYHGTWSHSDHPNRKPPEDMPKPEFGELLLRLAYAPFQISQMLPEAVHFLWRS